eukprot:CAMPEP_0198524012 /NCGR_PEP_ID=MMETSP1462-20131121/22497_1 /TAXON_ID=1333877 /ORGANISM="Brandtodinium nutriculum, Strain RCC3387" /LENGTH=73 /DNA_ID=CAMNT_0044253725 /DNA_START=42 /DNA_END=260 /DNA_ORIENTATION=+
MVMDVATAAARKASLLPAYTELENDTTNTTAVAMRWSTCTSTENIPTAMTMPTGQPTKGCIEPPSSTMSSGID